AIRKSRRTLEFVAFAEDTSKRRPRRHGVATLEVWTPNETRAAMAVIVTELDALFAAVTEAVRTATLSENAALARSAGVPATPAIVFVEEKIRLAAVVIDSVAVAVIRGPQDRPIFSRDADALELTFPFGAARAHVEWRKRRTRLTAASAMIR